MSDSAVSATVAWRPAQSLPGLEGFSEYRIRPLPPATLYPLLNRLFRFEFPPQRDYLLWIHIVNKGLATPHWSKQQLGVLPMVSVERLAERIILESIQSWELPPAKAPAVLNAWLAVVMGLEETAQHPVDALVSEDLALQEEHPAGGLHGHYFRPIADAQSLGHVLETLNYPTHFLPAGYLKPFLGYWLCRRLSLPIPWNRLLDEAAIGQMPNGCEGLSRLAAILRFLQAQTIDHAPTLADVSQIKGWIHNEFREFSGRYRIARPVRRLILVEGSTEALLIPAMARAMGIDPAYEGLEIVAVGGKNQMLQQYVGYAEQVRGPIHVVLDRDADTMLPDLNYYCRPQDAVHLLEEGEFEDLYPPELIVKTVQQHYQPVGPVTIADFTPEGKATGGQAGRLQRTFLDMGLGLFDKVSFALALSQNLNTADDLSSAMTRLMHALMAPVPDDVPQKPLPG